MALKNFFVAPKARPFFFLFNFLAISERKIQSNAVDAKHERARWAAESFTFFLSSAPTAELFVSILAFSELTDMLEVSEWSAKVIEIFCGNLRINRSISRIALRWGLDEFGWFSQLPALFRCERRMSCSELSSLPPCRPLGTLWWRTWYLHLNNFSRIGAWNRQHRCALMLSWRKFSAKMRECVSDKKPTPSTSGEIAVLKITNLWQILKIHKDPAKISKLWQKASIGSNIWFQSKFVNPKWILKKRNTWFQQGFNQILVFFDLALNFLQIYLEQTWNLILFFAFSDNLESTLILG